MNSRRLSSIGLSILVINLAIIAPAADPPVPTVKLEMARVPGKLIEINKSVADQVAKLLDAPPAVPNNVAVSKPRLNVHYKGKTYYLLNEGILLYPHDDKQDWYAANPALKLICQEYTRLFQANDGQDEKCFDGLKVFCESIIVK